MTSNKTRALEMALADKERQLAALTVERDEANRLLSENVGLIEDFRKQDERLRAMLRIAEYDRDRLRDALTGTLGLIRKAQERLCGHLRPDSTGDDGECLDDLLVMFDGPEQREIESVAHKALTSQPPAKPRPEMVEGSLKEPSGARVTWDAMREAAEGKEGEKP